MRALLSSPPAMPSTSALTFASGIHRCSPSASRCACGTCAQQLIASATHTWRYQGPCCITHAVRPYLKANQFQKRHRAVERHHFFQDDGVAESHPPEFLLMGRSGHVAHHLEQRLEARRHSRLLTRVRVLDTHKNRTKLLSHWGKHRSWRGLARNLERNRHTRNMPTNFGHNIKPYKP